MTREEQEAHIFGNIFLLATKLQQLGDHYLAAEEITTKQWFLTAVIAQYGEDPPTLSAVADVMNTSRQNIKQLASKLVDKGFLAIEPDRRDARAVRLKQTEKSKAFWTGRQERDRRFLQTLFRDFDAAEIGAVAAGLEKILVNSDQMAGN